MSQFPPPNPKVCTDIFGQHGPPPRPPMTRTSLKSMWSMSTADAAETSRTTTVKKKRKAKRKEKRRGRNICSRRPPMGWLRPNICHQDTGEGAYLFILMETIKSSYVTRTPPRPENDKKQTRRNALRIVARHGENWRFLLTCPGLQGLPLVHIVSST